MNKEIVKACVKCGNKLFTGFDHGECFERIQKNDAELFMEVINKMKQEKTNG